MPNPYDPNGYPVATVEFTIAGVKYKPGKIFPWRSLGAVTKDKNGKDVQQPLPEIELRGLYLSGRIDFPSRKEMRVEKALGR